MIRSTRDPYRYSFDPPQALDPDPLYAQLRTSEPVAWVEVPYGRAAWLATRHAAVRTVFSDPRFSRALAIGPDTPRPGPVWPRENEIMSLDPPEHTRLRKLIAPVFTMRHIEKLRPRAEEITEKLLDAMAEHGPPVDLVQALTVPLPVKIICEMLGVPYADRNRFGQWSRIIMSTTTYTQEEVDEAYESMDAYLAELISERHRQPTDDMLSALVRASDDNGHISESALVGMASSFLANGHETTANQIGNFVYTLLTHPDQWAWLCQDLSHVPGAVEELLRFVPLAAGAPSAGGHARIATTDVDLDGVTIQAGEAVLPAGSSANRDGEVFPNADQLDLTRAENPHVAFGYGPHHCPGAALARMELRVSLTALLRRFPTLELAIPADEVPWKIGMQRGPAQLPVTW